MRKICKDCGREFIAIKPHFVTCFDCYHEGIKQARAAIFFYPDGIARRAILAGKASRDKRGENKQR